MSDTARTANRKPAPIPMAPKTLRFTRQAVGTMARLLGLTVCCCLSPLVTPATAADVLPEIRLDANNRVPACVTPDRLMAFVAIRNRRLDPRFRDLAKWYRHHGEAMRVRWDYAFFQMALETNFLTYRRPDGRPGDVDPRQNNFAGIGATGGGVAGDRFPDIATGVLAQVQHLVAYSGEPLARPVAPRTQAKQDVIVAASRRLARPIRFSDLARRWAADPRYGASIAVVADTYHQAFCQNREASHVERSSNARPAPQIAKSYLGGPLPPAEPAAIVTPPKPKAVDRTASPRSIFRTIWRRGDPPPTAIAGWNVTATTPQAPAANDITSGLLGGLQAIAQSVNAPLVLVPPPPRLVLRATKAPQ